MKLVRFAPLGALALVAPLAHAEVPAAVSTAITGVGTDMGTVIGLLTVAGVAVFAGVALYRKFFKI